MVGVGTALTAGKWGLGLSILTALVGRARGENAGAIDGWADNISTDGVKWFLSLVAPDLNLDEDVLTDNIESFKSSALVAITSLLLAPEGYKKFGVFAALAMTAQKLLFPDLFNSLSGASSARKPTFDIDQVNKAMARMAYEDGTVHQPGDDAARVIEHTQGAPAPDPDPDITHE